MSHNRLFVKNMVCRRCVLAVQAILESLHISYQKIIAGEIQLTDSISEAQVDLLRSELAATGLELIENRMNGIIEKMKYLVIQKARNEVAENEIKMKLSAFLSKHVHHEYTYMSSLFSSIEVRTIENYFIEQRIEKVKELLVYKEMTLSEISFEMEYSSVAHLSNQFKKITGLTPTHFKQVGFRKRTLLDQV